MFMNWFRKAAQLPPVKKVLIIDFEGAVRIETAHKSDSGWVSENEFGQAVILLRNGKVLGKFARMWAPHEGWTDEELKPEKFPELNK